MRDTLGEKCNLRDISLTINSARTEAVRSHLAPKIALPIRTCVALPLPVSAAKRGEGDIPLPK